MLLEKKENKRKNKSNKLQKATPQYYNQLKSPTLENVDLQNG